MKKHTLLLVGATAFFGVFFVVGRVAAAEYYVSPTGSDTNPGSIDQPFASLEKGHSVASAGDTIWIRGGTYHLTKQVKLSKSGTSDANRIKFWAYQSEAPIFDCSQYVTSNTAADVPVILLTGNWLHLRGFEVSNAKVGVSGDHSYSLVRSEGASNNTFELLNLHHGFGPGLFISKGNGGNLILNCDSHDNYDKNGSQGDGQNGDGFGVHYQSTGTSTIVRGCRAWLNSDDGYDLIQQEYPVIVEGSWAVRNGYANGGSTSPADGNGNGFKMGSSDTGVRHIVQRNVAWKNKAAGFYANHSSGGNNWFNNTSYMNGTQYNMLASPAGDPNTTITLTGAIAHKMRNNVGFPNKNTNMNGVDTAINTWDLGITEATTDFASTTDTDFTAPRQPDGSIPNIDFLKLKAGSPLIDKGTDVGLTYVGSAPDLGAYEYGTTPNGGAPGGGATGAGGAMNTAGATSSGSGGRAMGGNSNMPSGGRAQNAGGATSSGSGGATSTNGGSGGRATGGNTNTGSGGVPSAGGSTPTPGSGGSAISRGGGFGDTGGASLGTGGASPNGGSSSSAGSGAEPGETSGCSCHVAGSRSPLGSPIGAGVALFALAFARRRTRGGVIRSSKPRTPS